MELINIYISPSRQTDNRYAYGNTTEGEQCPKIAEACRAALVRTGRFRVMVASPSEGIAARCAASDKFGAKAHIPIHTNAFNNKVSGTRIFCYNTKGDGYKISNAIFKRLAPITPGTSESVQVAGYDEITIPKAPTAYVEVDFHDNPVAAKWIVEHTTEAGETIARGICDYFGVTFVEPEVPKPAQPEQSAEQKLYRVQVGAFANRDNAEKMVQRLKAAGFDAFIRQDA